MDQQIRQRLDHGEVVIDTEAVDGSPLPRVVVLAVIEASPARVWRIIDQVSEYHRTMGGVKSSTEISRGPVQEGEQVRARITVKMPFPLRDLTSVTDAVHTVEPDRRYERRWRLVEGDYRENRGGWVLTPFDDDSARTLVSYTLHAVPNIRIPAALHGVAQRKIIPRLIDHLRRQV